jgi:hypothetical protein
MRPRILLLLAEGPMTKDEARLDPSDRTLLERYRRGCDDAATQMYLRYARRLHGS